MFPHRDQGGRKLQPGPNLCFPPPFEVYNLHPLLRHACSPGVDSAKCSGMFAGEEAADLTFKQVLILLHVNKYASVVCTTRLGRNRVINAEKTFLGAVMTK